MQFVESFDLFGTKVKPIASIRGSGAPTAETEGAVGCLYMDTDTGNIYKCVGVANGVYTWLDLGGAVAVPSTYRHIRTVTVTEEEGAKQIDVDTDSEGNPFACSDFLIFATYPITTAQIQVYIGSPCWNWITFEPGAMATTEERKWRINLKHLADGYWGYDGVYTKNASYQSESTLRSTIRSDKTFGEKLSNLSFWAQGVFPKGTIIEIYGK